MLNLVQYVIVCYVTQCYAVEAVTAQWCNPLTLQPEQLGGVGAEQGGVPPLVHCDKELATSAIPAFGAKNQNFTLTFTNVASSVM